jgi:ribose transport system substrate-binding protein
MRTRWLAAILLVGLVLPAACTRRDGAPGTKGPAGKKAVGLSVLTMTNPFFKEIADNFSAELAKHGYEAVVVSGEFDPARQHDQVKDFLTQKVTAIVLCPCNSKSVGASIRLANEQGVPVFTADIACLDPGAKVVTHIATDNYEGGKQAARAVIEALGEAGGKVLVLDFREVESCILRVKGFKEVIEAHNKDAKGAKVEIVAELSGGGDKERGAKVTADALERFPDLAGIFAINDPSALGAYAALVRAGKADQVKIVGFDGQPEGKQAIRDGKIYADPIQHPDEIGRKAAGAVVSYFQGEPPPAEVLIPTQLYRKADAQKDPSLK